jgi:PAS domain S-box-containing protein
MASLGKFVIELKTNPMRNKAMHQKKLEVDRQPYQIAELIFENGPDAMVLFDRQGRIYRANNRCHSVFGYLSEELIGKNLELLIPDFFRDGHKSVWQQFFQESCDKAPKNGSNFYSLRKDGSAFMAHINFATIVAPNVVMAVMRDVSGLTLQNELVEQLLGQRENFASVLMHDIQAPLLQANKALKHLVEDVALIAGKKAELLKTIFENNEIVCDKVCKLMDVYEYDSGKKSLKLASHNMGEMLAELVRELQVLAQASEIALSTSLLSEAVFAVFDLEEIRLVIQNLVENAIDNTPPRGSIEISIELSPEYVTIVTADTGKGISEHDKLNLFERFWQPEQNGRKHASTGLGLYLCRKIVEMHQGKIWCESKPGKGSTFSFSLPNARPQALKVS